MGNLIRSKQQYGTISQNIMRHPYITTTAKALYAYLASFAGADNSAFPSRDLICGEMGLNKDTYLVYMWELRFWGIVQIEQGEPKEHYQQQRGEKGHYRSNVYIVDHFPLNVMMDRDDFKEKIWPELEKDIRSKRKQRKVKDKNAPKNENAQISAFSPCPDLPDTVEPDTVNPDTNNNNLNNTTFKRNININNNNIKDISGENRVADEPQNSVVVEHSKSDFHQSNLFAENRECPANLGEYLSSAEDVVQEFSAQGIKGLSASTIEMLRHFSNKHLTQIAKTLSLKRDQGKVRNPAGLLSTHPEVPAAILRGEFYPDLFPRPGKRKSASREYEIYVPP